jgi:hypothetical protein
MLYYAWSIALIPVSFFQTYPSLSPCWYVSLQGTRADSAGNSIAACAAPLKPLGYVVIL